MKNTAATPEAHGAKVYTIAEAAAVLKMGIWKFKQLMAAGEIRVVRDGRWVRVPVTELDLFIENRLG